MFNDKENQVVPETQKRWIFRIFVLFNSQIVIYITMATNKYIQEIYKELDGTSWSKPHVTYIMAQFRKFLEENNLKGKYKFLNLFCNWTLHNKIELSRPAYEIMEHVTDAFLAHNQDPQNAQWPADAVIEGLSFHKLLEDILKFGLEFNITRTSKFSDLNLWKNFAKTLFDILIEQPLTFPNPINGSAKPIYDSITHKTTAAGDPTGKFAVTTISLYLEVNGNKNPRFFKIDTRGNEFISIVGNMAFINQEIIDQAKNK